MSINFLLTKSTAALGSTISPEEKKNLKMLSVVLSLGVELDCRRSLSLRSFETSSFHLNSKTQKKSRPFLNQPLKSGNSSLKAALRAGNNASNESTLFRTKNRGNKAHFFSVQIWREKRTHSPSKEPTHTHTKLCKIKHQRPPLFRHYLHQPDVVCLVTLHLHRSPVTPLPNSGLL